MCGIAGIVLQPHNRLPDLAARLTTMAGPMAHQGSDDEKGMGSLRGPRRQRCTATNHYTPQSAGSLPP